MVKKKAKGIKSSNKKGEQWQKEDVQVHTGLPPQVEGQLRCFLRLSIQQIVWISPSPPEVTHVRVKWWGEDSDGALFRPHDVKKNDKSQCRTVARYPIRSGPKQFASYLSDMGSILLEVLNGPLMIPIGYAEVTQIGQLSPSRPVNGFFPVFTDQDQKIAEIQVSLVLESLMASYDSNGSVPTTDVSFETQATQESMYPQRHQPVPHSQAPQKPVDDPFISPASHQNENGMANGFTDYASDLRQKLNYSMNELPSNPPVKSGSTVAITTNGDVVTTDLSFLDQTSQNKKSKKKAGSPTRSGKDRNLLSVLLERGNKLRDQMVISSIDDDNNTVPKVTNGPDVSMNGVDMSGVFERRGSTGSLFREILKKDQEKEVDLSALDSRAVDLMFGGTGGFDYNMLMNGSPGSSECEDIDLISDPGDPIHNESILQDLFYKNPESEASELSGLSGDEKEIHKAKSVKANTSMASLEDPANQRPPSRRSSISSMNIPPGEEPDDKENKPKKKAKTPKRKARLKTKRTGSKKRRRSRSSARSSASEYSDSERACTPRSEISQVSFDLPASDLDEPEYDETSKRKKIDGLSVERLTLLGRVHVARVSIDALHLTGQELNTSSSSQRSFKFKTVGKPPKPSKGKKSMTYFIEYQFPVVATSRDKYSPNALATEVMRVASKNVNNGLVQFNHRSVFPIMFDGNAIDNWWKSALVFKVYARSAGQKVPSLIGSCGIPMKSVLKSESLLVDRELEVRESTNKNTSLNSSSIKSDMDGLYGNLKVSIELASDSKDFSSHLARTKLAEMSGKTKIVPIPAPAPSKPRPPPAPSQNVIQTQPELKHFTTQPNISAGISQAVVSSAKETQSAQQMPREISYQPQYTDYEHVTLHTLLLVPEGRNISTQGIPSLLSMKKHPVFPPQPHALSPPGVKARDMSVRNTYLACRMFWCDDSVHSNVSWGTFDPLFNFSQVAPMLMSTALLERMRNNFMVIEVWDKKTSAENDQLIGIVKISLHQFYMSFRDKKIANTLLKSQFPVIAVDNYLPIVNPLNGSQFGQLQVCLAMGSAEQVAALQRIKLDGIPANHLPERPQHYLERSDMNRPDGAISQPHIGTDSVVEHIFEVVIEGLRGLNAFENMIWGEADCFVQYQFPAQANNQVKGGPVIKHAVPGMKSFRSATTLCIPDPTFNDVTRHRIILPLGTPVQRELLTACAGIGGSGLPYEVWCRYYHPNVRDQCVAKTNLPLAKLCAMVTMQKRGEPSVQTFSLPLTQVGSESEQKDSEMSSKMKESGLLDVTIHYKTNTVQSESSAALQKNLSDSQVCLSVSVIRASGLKAAAEAIARLDTGMQYPAEIGVNSYVKVKLSFLQKQDERITRTVARSFSPEFSHHMDFPCPLLWTEPDSDAMTLAEILESGEITLEVWHQIPGLTSDFDRQIQDVEKGIKGRQLGKTGDVLLGTVTLPLAALLVQRTGINGWFPVNSPPSGWNNDTSYSEETYSSAKGLERVVGGLELAVKFAHHNDRERVVHAARGVGWSPIELNIEEEEVWESDDEGSGCFQNITVSVDQVCFPVQNALITGQNSLDKSARCYVRYKFYDKGAIVSKIVQMSVNSEGYIVAQLGHHHGFNISVTSPFRWYLREEKLEVQLWVTYGSKKHHKTKPQHRDKLIGMIYIDLESLNDDRRKQHRISGMYPLFKPGVSSLGGAFIRAHVTSKPKFGTVQQESDEDLDDLEKSVEEDPDYDPNDSFHQLSSPKKDRSKKSNLSVVQEVPPAPTFSVVISIDRALHLPHIVDKSRTEESLPNTYVSYQTAESSDPSYTTVYHNSDSPIWDHQHETKLSTEMLYEENKNLVFKVWHKPHGASKEPDKSADRVLGFVSVDLTPLSSGLQQICGWYNITDFNGQCKGQIMVNICPTESVAQYNNLVSDHGVQPTSLPPGVSASGIWFSDQPMSLPTSTAPFSSHLPHFNYHYDQVKSHHEQLQLQLSENIRAFLQQQQESLETPVSTLPSMPTLQTSLSTSAPAHVPNILSTQVDSCGGDSSRSFLFTSLRKQMQDLDDITNKLKQKLVTSPSSTLASHVYHQPQYVTTNDAPHLSQSGASIPVTCQSQPLANSLTQSASSVVSSLQFAQSQQDTVRQNEVELMLTGSQEVESSQTGADSGAFSATHSSEKYQENDALDSHRSGGSDKMDTFRFGTTPRDFVGFTETTSTFACDSTPRDQSNNSDTGINMKFTPREDELLSTSNTGFTSNATPRDPTVLGVTPRENYSPREITEHSDPSSLGFYYHGENSQRSTGSFKLDSARSANGNGNGNGNGHGNGHAQTHDPKEMSIIQENTEYEGSDGEGDPNYYHRYRDILDEEENEGDDHSDAEGSDEDVVMPRTLNDISGKFGGIPSANDRLFQSKVPKSANNSAIHTGDNRVDADSFFDIESVPNPRTPQQTHMLREQFIEKDSWFSDNEDDLDKFAYKPSWTSKNKDSEKLHLNFEENNLEDEHLLEKVDLESVNSGSATHREQASRSSSAGSRRSAPSRSEHLIESEAVKNSPRTLYSKVVDELDEYFHPEDGKTKAQNESDTTLISEKESDIGHEEQTEAIYTMANGTINSISDDEEEAIQSESESRTVKKSCLKSAKKTDMPNFFLPAQHLEASMKALDIATSRHGQINGNEDSEFSDDPEREQEKTKEAYSLKQKLSQQHKAKFTGMPSKGRQLPTAEETKRIAKIFSSKIS